jgi:predicted phage-related endonuclease
MTKRRRPAAELVLPRTAPREAWLAERRKLIGSSDIADILGAGRHGPLSTWADKTGRVPDRAFTVDMARGVDFEAAVAKHWRRYHPELTVTRTGLMRSTRYRRAGASVDFRSRCPLGRCVTEVKTQALLDEWGTVDDPEVPVGFQFQGQWQMFVLGVDHVHYLVMGPHRWHIFERVMRYDPELAEWMACQAARFWGRYVIADVAPPAEATDREALQAMWPEPVRGQSVSLDGAALDAMRVIVSLRDTIAVHQANLAGQLATVQAAVGDATEVYWPDGTLAATWRPSRTILGADSAWQARHAEQVARHAAGWTIDKALMARLRALPLPVDVRLALELAEPAGCDLAALVNGGPLPDGLRYKRTWLTKGNTHHEEA